MKKKLEKLLITLIVLTLLCTGIIIGMFIPKKHSIDYVQVNFNETSSYIVIGCYLPENYTSDEIEELVLSAYNCGYDNETNLFYCSFDERIATFNVTISRVQLVMLSNCFIRCVDYSLRTSASLLHFYDNYFGIQITFWKLINK